MGGGQRVMELAAVGLRHRGTLLFPALSHAVRGKLSRGKHLMRNRGKHLALRCYRTATSMLRRRLPALGVREGILRGKRESSIDF